MVEAAKGFATRAAGLYGAAEALLQSIGATGQVTVTRVQDRYLSLAMEALGESAFRGGCRGRTRDVLAAHSRCGPSPEPLIRKGS
jgi:hypothetical protein